MQLRQVRQLGVFGLVLLSLWVGLVAGVLLDRRESLVLAQAPSPAASGTPDFALMTEAWNTIQRVYVDRSAIQTKPLTYGAISGMVDALGDTGHSTFLSPQEVQQERNYTSGQFEGIGATVEKQGDRVVIVSPLDGSPAQKAGLKPGDIIEKVNGHEVTGQSAEQVVSQVLGPAGTSVTLTILDPRTRAARDITIVRARIQLQNVTWQRIPGTTLADVRVAGFSQGVTHDLKVALGEIKQQHLTGVILDMRNNPGGLLDEAVGVASQFLPSGNVLLTRDAQGVMTPVPVRSDGVAIDLPLAVLVDNGTASAAEIVAGALQDARRANLVGETTYGTGTVLSEFSLSDGSALLLATEEWLTPKGRVIWHQGITPDLVVLMPATSTLVTPNAIQGMTAAQLESSNDNQLLTAVYLLK